jgi:hypothetical protein
MTDGDAAAAAGLPILSQAGTDDRRNGYAEINKTRDQLVQRVFPNSQLATVGITKGGTGQITAPLARTALGVPEDASGSAIKFTSPSFGRIAFEIPGLAFLTTLANLNDVPDLSGYRALSNGTFGVDIFVPGASPATSGYSIAYINGDGRLSRGASARRLKQDIQDWAPDKQALLAVKLVQFRVKAAVKELGDDAPIDYGVIADDLLELGLDWLVYCDDDGKPLGVHYEKITLALIAVAQDHEDRLAKLEGKVFA